MFFSSKCKLLQTLKLHSTFRELQPVFVIKWSPLSVVRNPTISVCTMIVTFLANRTDDFSCLLADRFEFDVFVISDENYQSQTAASWVSIDQKSYVSFNPSVRTKVDLIKIFMLISLINVFLSLFTFFVLFSSLRSSKV